MAQFLRDVPHVLWVLILTLVLLGAYVFTRDIAIQTLLIGAAGAFLALSKAQPPRDGTTSVETVQGDLNVAEEKTP